MYIFADLLLAASFACCMITVGALVMRQCFENAFNFFGNEVLAKSSFWFVTAALSLCSAILFYAFIACDFQLEYVAAYSSRSLPLFYRVTAFWAGQQGSMLFWAWTVALGGIVFVTCKPYKKLCRNTKDWFWIFFFTILGFFLYILLGWSNPFIVLPLHIIPIDGNGLNPLLQDPGMIFHPPLLFLGYGGFAIPGCLALAQAMSGVASNGYTTETHWADAVRPFILSAWLLLTAGIILGAWWAYMELGWGGYWAWDPVENASLIPWLIATAYLHTAIIEHHRKKLLRVNIFLMILITISTFFATYLVRSGVIKSLHAFGEGGLGMPFVIFVVIFLFIALFASLSVPRKSEPLEDLVSREGLLVIVAWVLLSLSAIILIGTMWPVIIKNLAAFTTFLPSSAQTMMASVPTGLTESFYNRVCLPLFAIFAVLLLFCPHTRWKGGFNHKGPLLVALVGAICSAALLWFLGFKNPLAMIAAASAIGGIAGLATLFTINPGLFKISDMVAAHGVHIGFLFMVIGVAFSGPYAVKTENIVLAKGLSAEIGQYNFTLDEIWTGESASSANGKSHYAYYEAAVAVRKNTKSIGKLTPQLRRYDSHPDSLYPQISTIPSLGNELYASLMGIDDRSGTVNLTIYINPLVNWLWIGGIIMSILPIIGIRRIIKEWNIREVSIAT